MVRPGCASNTLPYKLRARCSCVSLNVSNPRSAKNWCTTASSLIANSPNQSCKRACISCAALRVKVMARICEGCAPSSSRCTKRDTSSQVHNCIVAHRQLAQPELQARLHFLRRLARKGDGEDLRRLRAIQQQTHDARHQQPGLAAARAGFDDDTAFRVEGDVVDHCHSPLRHTPRISQ